jgi:hypothetical protein
VQASINTISFPTELEQLDRFFYVDEEADELTGWATDIDLLLEFETSDNQDLTWTTPRWMTEGDILFFYHAKNAKPRIARLLREAETLLRELESLDGEYAPEQLREDIRFAREVVRLLKYSAAQAQRYSGHIFGCGEVTGPTEYEENEGDAHFSTKFFAPLGRVHIFEHPLPAERFANFVKITQSTPNTPLYEEQFEGIKRQFSENNSLPAFLSQTRIGEAAFYNVDKENWPEISCSADARFIHETQLRAYFLDFLLAELKDPRSPLLKECRCYRDGISTGIADYFARVNGKWIPVEAKLNVLTSTEEKLLKQARKYTRVDHFIPTLGERVGEEYAASRSPLCLVADQSGIYLVAADGFRGCSFGKALWRRANLDHQVVREIREKIAEEERRC